MSDAGYSLAFYCGRPPSLVAQVLADLNSLPATLDASPSLKTKLAKRWKAAGVGADDLKLARRNFAKTAHPDITPDAGKRLAIGNAVIDHALENT